MGQTHETRQNENSQFTLKKTKPKISDVSRERQERNNHTWEITKPNQHRTVNTGALNRRTNKG